MLNLIQADIYKILRSKPIKICFIVMCISASLVTLISFQLAKGNLSNDIIGIASGLSDIMMMTLVGPLIAGFYISGDFENKTIYSAVSYGYSRATIVYSKAIVFSIIMCVMALPYVVATSIGYLSGATFSKPFAASVFLGILNHSSAVTLDSILKMLGVMATSIIVYCSMFSICVLLAFVLRKPIWVMSVGVVLLLFLEVIGSTAADWDIIGPILDYTPFSKQSNVVTMNASNSVFSNAIFISLLFISWVLAITHGLFAKSEIK